MSLTDINSFVFVLLSNIAALLLTPPYNWFTAVFIIGCVIALISALINIGK